ncbi:MFS transporter [Actinomadura sp. WMMB 499]|uniref:MFS transporter n=1 Tax=Actinomadura sp. WMMB 499 TaxID=1219491 RepID=UPI00159E7710|nr:MFS transporter [Actinomadura sp. WMMB 499]
MAATAKPPSGDGPLTGAPVPDSRRAWTVVVLLVLFMMINFMDKAVLGLAGDHIREDLGLTDTEFGSIGSVFFLLFSVSGVAVGFLADRVPAKWLLIGLVAVWSASQLAVALPAAGLLTLMITRVTLGAAEGPAFAMANHTAFSWFPDRERALPSMLLATGGAFGVALGAPVLAVLITSAGWRSAFLATGLLGVLWVVLWLAKGGEGGHSPRSAAAEDGPRVPYRRLFTSGTILGGLAAGFAAYWAMAVAITWLPQYLQRVHGIELETASLIAAGTQVVGIAVMLSIGYASTRMMRAGRSSHAALGLLGGGAVVLSGLAMPLVTRSGGGAVFILVLVVAYTFGNSFLALLQAAAAELAPVRQRGAVLGTVTALASLAGALGPVLTGAIVDAAGTAEAGFRNAFDLGAALMIVGGLLAAAFVRPARDRAALGTARPQEPAPAH